MGKVIRERDAEVAREAILEAAEEVFARVGFAGARIDAIGAEAGYNKSLIFHYFGGKEGLYRAIIVRLKKRMMDGYLEPLTAFVQSSDEMSVSRLRIFLELNIDRYCTFLSKNPRNLHIMAWEAAEGWHTFLGDIKELEEHRACMICLGSFLHSAQEAGIINPKLNTRFVFLSILHLCVMYLLNLPRYEWFLSETLTSQPETLAFARQQIVELILHGIVNPSLERSEK
ncbi:TetR family transcriptional regulator [Reticulibacter mediterranei]|uniref:TetR family transcriptional regulator n=1 Tax=Reticulibacter mediterranei TaxID=2778369 RepID=A0A8J3NAB3_9CHLR|nr:TetR/AcrR family transcriptional regulator [Reticulibacter mediterranei]GHP00203.1 TetR family transcriptional regulator [Reticulibacter mediterranei]